MPSPAGKNWSANVWQGALFGTNVWSLTYDRIGYAWASRVWGEGVWNPYVWDPHALFNAVIEIHDVRDLTTATSSEGASGFDATLSGVYFYMKPGGLLDVEKTLPIIKVKATPKTLTVIQSGLIDANTLSAISANFSPGNLVIGMVLPPISMKFTPQAFTDIGLILKAIKMLFRPRVSSDGLNLTTDPSGVKGEQRKLIRRGKGLFRRSAARKSEDLINEIVDEIDAPDYAKEQ